MMDEEKPAFDSTRKALVFAFNSPDAWIAPPVMNKMMAAVVINPKKTKKGVAPPVEPDSDVKRPSRVIQPGDLLRKLDRATQAGFILGQVARLDPKHQDALKARLIKPKVPCECRSLCCQGWRVNLPWSFAIGSLIEDIKETGNVLRIPGKRGLSTEPRLRRLIVERFFNPDDSRSIAIMARKAEVSAITAAKHVEWIQTYLEQTEQEAWVQIDAIFDQTGITGLIDF